jgi:DNA-binding MarR family transcriptional regulator
MDQPRESTSGYWYGQDARSASAVDVLNGLRRYRQAETAMRRRTREAMRMGETDLLALQFLLRSVRDGVPVGPRDLAAYLRISSASTTVLIDRLVKSGHLERQPHPTDRRALLLVPTVSTDEEVRNTLGQMHSRMLAAAEELSPEEMDTVLRFLDSMRVAVDTVDPEHDSGSRDASSAGKREESDREAGREPGRESGGAVRTR